MSEASFSEEDEEHVYGPPSAFTIGHRVRKVRGSSWQGRVVGYYSTTLTPQGYVVESEREPGSVQLYPESALEAVPASYPISQFSVLERQLVDSQHRLVGALQRAADAEERLEQINAKLGGSNDALVASLAENVNARASQVRAAAERIAEIATTRGWMREVNEDETK